MICQHVATWKEGEEKWAYHDDAFENIATHKVSLDPYRLESRRILTCIKETLPANLQKVEKASVDEVFMDVSAQVHSIMLDRYPELIGPPPCTFAAPFVLAYSRESVQRSTLRTVIESLP